MSYFDDLHPVVLDASLVGSDSSSDLDVFANYISKVINAVKTTYDESDSISDTIEIIDEFYKCSKFNVPEYVGIFRVENSGIEEANGVYYPYNKEDESDSESTSESELEDLSDSEFIENDIGNKPPVYVLTEKSDSSIIEPYYLSYSNYWALWYINDTIYKDPKKRRPNEYDNEGEAEHSDSYSESGLIDYVLFVSTDPSHTWQSKNDEIRVPVVTNEIGVIGEKTWEGYSIINNEGFLSFSEEPEQVSSLYINEPSESYQESDSESNVFKKEYVYNKDCSIMLNEIKIKLYNDRDLFNQLTVLDENSIIHMRRIYYYYNHSYNTYMTFVCCLLEGGEEEEYFLYILDSSNKTYLVRITPEESDSESV